MAKTQINLRIEENLDHRFDVLATKTGCSKAFYEARVIDGFLDEPEDYFLAKGALAEFRNEDDSTTVLHEDIDWDALGQ